MENTRSMIARRIAAQGLPGTVQQPRREKKNRQATKYPEYLRRELRDSHSEEKRGASNLHCRIVDLQRGTPADRIQDALG